MPNDIQSPRASACIIGAGPAGLMAAEALARRGLKVSVFDRMPSPGRKFLMAGRGGLNLTHSEEFEVFVARYGARAHDLRPALQAFGPTDLRSWCDELGEATFVGSSGRVFPKSFKASPLLRAWLRRLRAAGVEFTFRHKLVALEPRLGSSVVATFEAPQGPTSIEADVVVLAMGGASWPRLGSAGDWTPTLDRLHVALAPWRPANGGFLVDWSPIFRERFAGAPLKDAVFAFAGERLKGEAVITANGVEGGAIYTLSSRLRDAIDASGSAVLSLDLRPDLTEEALAARLGQGRAGDSLTQRLRKRAGLSPVAIALLREFRAPHQSAALPTAPAELAALIKTAQVRLRATAPLERAISSAGGVAFDALDGAFMLTRAPGVFVCGEMLDWEAPTGGYLLQASFATGRAAGEAAAHWIAARNA